MQIEGLNKRQRAMADILWGFNSKDDVLSFIHSLRGQAKLDAQLVMEMMIITICDEIETCDEAKAELDRIANL
jgi:hypothetical protein